MPRRIDGAEENFRERSASSFSRIPDFEVGGNAVEPVAGINIAARSDGDDDVFVDCGELADQFVLSEWQTKGAVRALGLAAGVKPGGDDDDIRFRG